MSKENRMGTAPMLPLIFSMALPAMFSMLVQALYNIVDSYFVSQVQMGLPPEEAHIAKFSEWRCEQVIQLCSQFLAPNTCAA